MTSKVDSRFVDGLVSGGGADRVMKLDTTTTDGVTDYDLIDDVEAGAPLHVNVYLGGVWQVPGVDYDIVSGGDHGRISLTENPGASRTLVVIGAATIASSGSGGGSYSASDIADDSALGAETVADALEVLQAGIDAVEGGGSGTVDFVYASRTEAAAASPSGSQVVVVHEGQRLGYVKDSSLTYPALTTADSAKWAPSGIITPLHYGAIGDGAADDYAALQTMLNAMGNPTSTGAAHEATGYQELHGLGKIYATSKPLIMGNVGSSFSVPELYFGKVRMGPVSLRAISGSSWSSSFGDSSEIPPNVLIMAWQLDESATEGLAGCLDIIMDDLEIDCADIADGLYLQNTMRVTINRPRIAWMKKNGKGISTSVGLATANVRGYKTINGALRINNPNIKGHQEEIDRHSGNGWPVGEDQDSMNVRAIDLRTNDAEITDLNNSRCRYALWADSCGANQILGCHPWSQELYLGPNAKNFLFRGIYFDWTKVTLDGCFTHTFVGCDYLFGTSDRGPNLIAHESNETGAGLSFVGCKFAGNDDDIAITYATDGGSWANVVDREIVIAGCVYNGSGAHEALVKFGKYFTIDGTDGFAWFQRMVDGYGRTLIQGNNVQVGRERASSGAAGFYMNNDTGDSVTGELFLSAADVLNLRTKSGGGDVKIGASGTTYITVDGDSTVQIGASTSGVSSANAQMKVYAWSGRSISASGTINASGADLAEYHEVKPHLYEAVAKGAVLGGAADGLLTDRFDDVVGRFYIKSTAPNLVGNDGWGTEENLIAKYGVEPVGEKPDLGDAEDITAEMQAEHDQSMTAWETRKEAMAAASETERKKHDRMAKSGIVPVNIEVVAEDVGKYLVPERDGEGGITAVLMTIEEMTLTQYASAIGSVIGVEADGRPLVEVKTS